MWLVRLALRRPVSVLVAVMSLALASALAIARMPVDIFPNLGAPAIFVARANVTKSSTSDACNGT